MDTAIATSSNEHERQPVVVDGSNVCFAEPDERGGPRLSNLITVRRLLLDHGFEPIIMCDASLKYNVDDRDRLQLEVLISRGDVREVPAGTDADVWVLEAAAQFEARIVSNDRYRQHLGRFPWASERRVPVMVVNGHVLLPGLIDPPAAIAPCAKDARPTDGAAPPKTDSTVAELDLVQELLAENAAIRISRDLLVEECQRVRAQAVQSNEAAASCRREQDRVAASLAVLEVRTVELDAQLGDAQSSLTRARETSIQADLARESAVAAANLASQQVKSLTDQVRLLERQNRPVDAEAEKATQRLLRDILRAVRLQAEPIQRAAGHASDTHKLVDALRTGQQSLANHAEAISTYLEQLAAAQSAAGQSVIGAETAQVADTWRTRFTRVERAWLANEEVGDEMEAACFRHCVRELRSSDRSLEDEDVLLAGLDNFAATVGEGFDYAALYDAVKKTRKPTLESPVLLVRTRDAVLRRGSVPKTTTSEVETAA